MFGKDTPSPCVCMCVLFFLSNFREDWREKQAPNYLPFIFKSLKIRQDSWVQGWMLCHSDPGDVPMSCRGVSSDGNATFTPNPTCVWHIGGPRGGRSLFSLCSLPLRGCAGASATSEALTVFLIIPVVSQGVPPSMASSGAEQIVLKSKKCCKMPV